jgi:murein L,D-transpeptidase YcbB/YkuD
MVVVAVAMVGAAGCKGKSTTHESSGEVVNWSPPNPATIAGVPGEAVRSAMAQRLQGSAPQGLDEDSWRHVRGLYDAYGGAPLWLDGDGIDRARLEGLTKALAAADSDALSLDGYPTDELARAIATVRRTSTPTAEQLAAADVLMTTTYAALGEDLLTGQVSPRKFSQSWYIDPKEEAVDSSLARSLRDARVERAMARMRPQDPGYDALRRELARYRDLAARGEWPQVPKGRAVSPGETATATRLNALAARLRAEGMLDRDVALTPVTDSTGVQGVVYSRELAGPVATFQARHGIGVDSVLGPETVSSLNRPVSFRLGQIAANLERFRWLPRTLGSRYVLVNVPAFRLQAFDDGKPVLEMKVIVGAEYQDRATPVFSDSMQYVIFRPYWNVPDSIAYKEIFPKAEQDPGYLERNDYEIVTVDGQRRVRQKPGDKNSLGLIKFMFPNDFAIYLHDTPEGELFRKDVRAFSHGCIRLEQPDRLAQFVLGWPADSVRAQMEHGPDDHRVNLTRRIPVFIVYFTTYVTADGLYFGNDLYSRDEPLVQAVQGAAKPSGRALGELQRVAGGR